MFKWHSDEYAEPLEWDPVISFSLNTSKTRRRHYFEIETLEQLLDGSLELKSLPTYPNVTPKMRGDQCVSGPAVREAQSRDWAR